MIAICLNWGLMGVLLVQICMFPDQDICVGSHTVFTVFYHVSFPKDSVTIKSLGRSSRSQAIRMAHPFQFTACLYWTFSKPLLSPPTRFIGLYSVSVT